MQSKNYVHKEMEMFRLIILLMLGLCGVPAMAADSGINVSGAWARATAPGQDNGMVQFAIASRKAAKLVAVTSPVADAAELHRMMHQNGQMEMRAVKSIALPAGKVVDLEKSGYHVMLIKLKHPLKAGGRVPLTLNVEFANKHRVAVAVEAEIVAPGASPGMHMEMGGMHHHEN